jgi:hypothetical protein
MIEVQAFGGGVLAEFSTGVVMTPAGPAPKSAMPKDASDISPDEWIPWGVNNLFPQEVVRLTEKSTIIAPAISKLVKYAYAGGIQVGTRQIVNGEEKFVPIIDKQFDQFKRRSNLSLYALEALSDMFWFGNVFPNLVVNKGEDKIAQLFVEEACYSRWEKPSKKKIEFCLVSANWDNAEHLNKDEIIRVDVLDQYFDPAYQIKDSSAKRFVYPVGFPSPNRFWYQLAPWNGAIASGWLAFSLQIPEFKTAMMKNQLTLKYHLEVNEAYWPLEFDGWDKLDEKVRSSHRQEFLRKFTENLADTKNVGKAIMTSFKYDRSGNTENMWKITPIDDKIKSGVYVEDSQEASTHLMNALELDPTLFGAGPGKGFSAGSGSDKNSAYNLLMVALKPIHDLILQPLYVVRDVNGWSDELEFRMAHTFMAESTSGKPRMVSGDEPAKPAQ